MFGQGFDSPQLHGKFKPCKSMICGAFLLIAAGKVELLINYAVLLVQKWCLSFLFDPTKY